MSLIKKAYAYCRVSSEKQVDGYGMTRQQKMILNYIKQYSDEEKKLGYVLSENNFTWILQPGQSAFHGYNLTKGELAEFIQRALEGKEKGACLIIENIDRFSRQNPLESMRVFLNLVAEGIHIHEVETGEIYSKKNLNVEVLASSLTRANRESQRKQKMSNASWDNRYENVLNGNDVLTKRVPNWITVHDKSYQLKPEYEIIQYIYDRFCEGYGSTTISRELNADNKLIGGASWYPQNVNRILSDERVCGWLVSSNSERDKIRVYPQIIKDEQFDKVQSIKKSKLPVNKHKILPKLNNLYNGITVCGCCGAAVGITKSKFKNIEYLRLYCSKRKTLGDEHCKALSIRYDFEEKILFRHILNMDWDKFLSKTTNQDEVTELQNQLIDKNKYLSEIEVLISDSLKNKKAPSVLLLQSLEMAQNDRDNLLAQLSSMTTSTASQISDVVDYDISIDENRRKYNSEVRRVIKSINITRSQNRKEDTYIDINYHMNDITHVIIMNSETGEIRTNFAYTKDMIYNSKFNIEIHNQTTVLNGIIDQIQLAYIISFMELKSVNESVINMIKTLI